MGKKRKREKTEEEIHQKIRKLQEQLAKAKNSNGDSSSEENLDCVQLDSPENGSLIESLLDIAQYEAGTPYSELPPSPAPPFPDAAVEGALPRPASTVAVLQATTPQAAVTLQTPNECELDDETLKLLGDAPKSEAPLGPAIHNDVALRWQDILAKGLPKDTKEALLKEYLIPENCDFLTAPVLNPEVKAALPDPLVKRDSSLVYKQKQLGVALSALATVTDMVISNEISKQKILKPLSDACRILCDSHYIDTRTRRKFVISSTNSKLKDTLSEATRDKFLFGENVAEKLKAAKTIQQSGNALRNAPRPKIQQKNVPSTSGTKGRLNFTPQHRKTDNKPPFDARKPSNTSQRQLQSSSVRRPLDHSSRIQANSSRRQ